MKFSFNGDVRGEGTDGVHVVGSSIGNEGMGFGSVEVSESYSAAFVGEVLLSHDVGPVELQ